MNDNVFDRMIGYKEVKRELLLILDRLQNPQKYQQLGVTPPHNLLLFGAPGVGKTMFARCFMDALGWKQFVCRKVKPNGDFVHEIADIFAEAEAQAPSVILLDDMDKFANEDERHRDAQGRVGGTLCAYEVICYARRLYRLMQLNAPAIVIRNEARTLAAAMALNRFDLSRDLVDNEIRLNLERMELMDDAQLDELFRPKHTNSRKSLAPLFVYLILKEQTDARHHLRQQDILKKLEEYPYEIFVERKTLSRIVHNLADSQLHIKVDKTGVWFEK